MSNANKYYRHQSDKSNRSTAGGSDPWVSAALVARMAFCRRAGIIYHEAQRNDDEEMSRAVHGLRYTFYNFSEIRQAINRTIIILLPIALLTTIYFFIRTHPSFINRFVDPKAIGDTRFFFGTLSLIGMVFLLIYGLYLLMLFWTYLQARTSAPRAPAPNSSEPQPINWWGMLNAGFQPIAPRDMYKDKQWHLIGRPWRILARGNLYIPVFRRRTGFRFSNGPDRRKLSPQHYAKMAAYCHLIERSEPGVSSPYGIILSGKTAQGVTVPYRGSEKGTLRKNVFDARTTLSGLGTGSIPTIPTNLEQCKMCPHSRKNPLTGASLCGIRFGWIPPNHSNGHGRF
jgi:hypothetical protein